MSDTTEAADRRLRHETPTIDTVRDLALDRVDATDAAVLGPFADIFLARAPDELLKQRSADDLASMTLGVFRFLQASRPYRVDVEVVNPTVEGEGWDPESTIIRTNVTERPFIIDSIREYLSGQEITIERMVYPLLDVERDAEGVVVAVRPPSDGGPKESIVHCEVGRIEDPERLARVRDDLSRRLQDVVRATDDFQPMLGAVERVVIQLDEKAEQFPERREELEEIQHFLGWLQHGGFVFLGYRAYDLIAVDGEPCIVVEPGSGLGLLRNEGDSRFAEPMPLASLEEGVRSLAMSGPMLIINKTNAESTVHRRARMDYVGVKKIGAVGEVTGEHRFIGLFTSKAYAESAGEIPILRRKLQTILADTRVREGSHDYKEIITIFNSLPREELFLSSAAEVGHDIRTVLTSYSTSGVTVTLREDPLHRGVSVMVILPKDRFSAQVRKSIEGALVEAYEGEVLNYHLSLGEGDQARLHFYLGADEERLHSVRAVDLEGTIGLLIRTWTDRVEEGLAHLWPADEAHRLATVYGDALSREYQAATDPMVAVTDIGELEALTADGRAISVSITHRGEDAPVAGIEGATELKVFLRGERLILSDFMPILEAGGLRVLAMKPYEVGGNGTPESIVYVFAVQDAKGRPLDVDDCGERLSATVLAARAGDVISDRLNALVVTAGLHWREVDVLRGYVGYAFQVGAVPSRLALPTALVRHPGIARLLFDLFQTKFDPDAPTTAAERLEAAADIRGAFQAALGGVSLLSEDRALRRLEELISKSVRTNYYRHGGRVPTFRSGGVPYLSYKFEVGDRETPRPSELLYEVWVHSARMEGVHLRGSTVARGGIRWSDRPDDFRTEVLGLVKTQMVKNAVIVPGGSKGGFVTRRNPADAEERFEEGKRQYRTLVRGLLDITDNIVAGRHVPPPGVFAFDPPDPYLVVAADKGTATFSDVANAIAAEYRFWLDDAFASGGSHGYDHKAVGITARGGWECVRRHFREMGKDIQSEPFTVVGIGDMSGDVFGNGMLLSEQIRLIGAFDHRHIFIDPDPDPARSFAERRRLFDLGRSSWEEYDRAALSPGAMIVPRGAKEVHLTPEARRALGIPDDADPPADGESLIRCVLRAPVELLWNGGIGTYVRASGETSADAGDPANDAVRVTVGELRCGVVGEGGNLGFTQRARVEYALLGGRINTDALDNSGGVDMSDHEVNLKILLAPAVASGDMSPEGRNELLQELTEAVAQLVLGNNRSQSLGISLDERRAREAMDDFRDLMFTLEKSGDLDRASERLPSLDVLVERRDAGQSIVRPELCVLLAYAKLSLKAHLLKSGLPDDPVTESYLLGYFPPAAIVASGQANLHRHRLRREIITAQLTNDLVDVMGACFVTRVARDSGRSTEEVVRAWLVASRLADHRALVAQMGEQGMNARVAYRWLLALARVLERTTRWVLHNVSPETPSTSVVDQNISGLATLREAFGGFVTGEDRQLFEARVREIQELGADGAFSRRLITLRFLDQLLEILGIARDTDTDPVRAGHVYYQVSEAFEVPWLRRRIFASAGDDRWEVRAAQALSEDLSRVHRRVVRCVVEGGEDEGDPLAGFRSRTLDRFRETIAELKAEESIGLPALSVATRELADVADRLAGGYRPEERR